MCAIENLSAQEAAGKIESFGGLLRMTMERRPRRPEGGITRLQAYLLHLVADRETIPMADLVQLLEVGRPTVSQFVSSLEFRGWMQRDLDPEDRRRHLVHITEMGRAVAEKSRRGRRLRMERVLERLTAEERGQLVFLAGRIAEIVASDPELLRRPLDVE